MSAEPQRFQTFEDLDAYKAAREFRKAMYQISKRLPVLEKFELGSQIRTAAVSLTHIEQWLACLPLDSHEHL